MNCEKIFKNVTGLHKISFTEILSIDNYDDDFNLSEKYYDFSPNGKYNNGRFKGKIKSCCHKCDDCNSIRENVSAEEFEKYKNYRLENISHGSHTIDYLYAAGYDEQGITSMFSNENWNDTPVLFLMENPSLNYEIYEKVGNKYPTKTWYWIHRKQEKPSDILNEDLIKQGIYGKMVYYLICKYKLANAYLTNVVKCGMNNKSDPNAKEGYLGTWWYKDDCKKTCINEILSKEVQALCNEYKEIKIITFGSNAYWLAKDFFQNSSSEIIKDLRIQLVQLPHPSSRLNNNYRKYVIYGILNDVLNSNKFELVRKPLPTKDNLSNEFNKTQINIGERSGQNCLAVKYTIGNSLFGESQIVTEVKLKGSKKNKIIGNVEFGYNFVDDVYWGWDYNKKDYIPTSEIEYFEDFKKVIESVNL